MFSNSVILVIACLFFAILQSNFQQTTSKPTFGYKNLNPKSKDSPVTNRVATLNRGSGSSSTSENTETEITYYDILGVPITATPGEINTAIRIGLLTYESEKYTGPKSESQLFVQAAQTLGHPAFKKQYDHSLFVKKNFLQDYYQTLNVQKYASQKEINEQYSILLRMAKLKEGELLRMEVELELKKAYETLSDPVKRQQYDRRSH